MQQSNPYQASDTDAISVEESLPSSRVRWALIGFVLGAGMPVGFGIYSLHQESLYAASLGPDEAACGMAALGSIVMIFIGGPFCGVIGGCTGWLAAVVRNSTRAASALRQTNA